MEYKKGINTRKWAMISTLLTTSSISADIISLRKQAETGDAQALFNLGVAYGKGQGVPQDSVQSYFWFSLAASRSSGENKKKFTDAMDRAEIKLTPEELMKAQRMTKE